MNFREIRHVSEVSANVIALITNLLIIVMALTENSNSPLKSYSRMIISASVVDLIYVCGSALSAQNVIIDGGAFIFISDSWFKTLPGDGVHYFMAIVSIFTIAISNYIVPIEYYFRWNLVVR
jgi:hypothetical protein